MGIPYLFRFLSARCAGALRTHPPDAALGCDVLYLDFNGIVHQCARAVIDDPQGEGQPLDEQVVRATLDYLAALLRRVHAHELVYVAVDGVPPRAKMQQQRARRYMAAWARPPGQWDTNAITPGTRFMRRLAAALHAFAAGWGECRVVVSDDGEPGEGEQKIMAHLRRRPAGEAFAIYGLDADLLLMALLCPPSHRQRLRLLREQELGGDMQGHDHAAGFRPLQHHPVIAVAGAIMELAMMLDRSPLRRLSLGEDLCSLGDFRIAR